MYPPSFDPASLLTFAVCATPTSAIATLTRIGAAPVRPPFWLINVIGSVAAVCTTLALVPQLMRVWRLKTARDVSLLMFLVYSVGELLWLIYGVYIHSMPVIAANAVSLVLALFILWLKLHYGDGGAQLAHNTTSAGK